MWRGSREEAVEEGGRKEGVGWGRVGLTAEEGGLGDTSKTKGLRTLQCLSVVSFSPHPHPPSPLPAWVSLQCSPCDHIGSEAEHEGADEGADLPRRSLSSPPLLLQATLSNTGNTGSSAGLQPLGTHSGKKHKVLREISQKTPRSGCACLYYCCAGVK